MTHNDALRSLRYLLNASDHKMVKIIQLTDFKVSVAQLKAYLMHEDEEGYLPCPSEVLAHFLNGLVLFKRGKDPLRPPQPVDRVVSNNLICKKLRTAFQLQDRQILALVAPFGLKISPAELAAFFRAEGHRNYRPCGDQFLRYFMKGLTVASKQPVDAPPPA